MVNKNLYTKTDTLAKSPLELIDGPGEYIIDPEEFNEEGLEVVSQLNSSITSIFNDTTSDSEQPKAKKPFFTFAKGKGKVNYNVTDTVFEPTRLTMVGGKFKEKYKKQLEEYIFNTKDTLDPESLFSIVYVYELLANRSYPIHITCPRHGKLAKIIVDTLNDFYKEHYHTLTSIHYMLNQSDPDKLFEEKSVD